MDDYNQWNKIKRGLSVSGSKKYFQEREVFYCYLGKNLGHEQDGKGVQFLRPVIIIKKFNNNIFWGIPTTTKPKTGKFYYQFQLNNRVTDYAILSQIKLIDAKRLKNKIGKIDPLPQAKGGFNEEQFIPRSYDPLS